ncbi:formin-like protein 5 [Punica granatum]|uniref:Formin-like protein n=1 Tax=Punica granatum TaxID=22663 RepID=A0A6P8EH03_PUNGR|nr:formin-like protein 5 [Punica granatum]
MLKMIQKQKCLRGVGCLIFLVTLLCPSVARLEEVPSDYILDWASLKIDQDTAELLWVNCRAELVRLRDTIEDLDLCFPHKVPNSRSDSDRYECVSFSKGNIREFLNAVHPELKINIVDCLRRNSLPFHVSGDEVVPNHWYSEYLESVSSRFDTRRRSLAASPPKGVARALEPGTVESPGSSPSPSHSLDPESPPPPPTPKKPFFPPSSDALSPKASVSQKNSSSGQGARSNAQSSKEDSNKRAILIAVIVTASVTFLLATLLFLCYNKVCRGRSRRGQNDERPLLSLSMTDYSVGSSYKPYGGYMNSIKEEKSNENIPSKASDGGVTAGVGGSTLGIALGWESFESPHANGNGQVSAFPPLKPPPGRMASNTGFLKPPPGRADPLPHEPPAPPKPPTKSGPPPPPPPPGPKPVAANVAAKPPGPPPPPPPARGGPKPGPPPPPPPKSSGPSAPRPPQPPGGGSKIARPLPVAPKTPGGGVSSEDDDDAPKTKLKPFFWDKVLANPDHSMVWHQIKSGSFQFNEEMIESLFGYAAPDKGKTNNRKDSSSQDSASPFVQIIDPKKAQNLAILLRALNVTIEEVCDALHEGNELPTEFVQTLLKMTPTADEELKLRLYNGELSQLGPADRFLKTLVGIPFAFKRIEALLLMSTLQEEVTSTKESFETLEVACKELRNSRLFLKLLEAVLKTGNRMNDGTFRGGAQAFKLDTLLKLSDVKGTDGKTTLLHFVVQEIIRSEGVRAVRVARESSSLSSFKSDDLLEDAPNETEEYYRSLGLQAVSGLGGELENVKKAAAIDADTLTGTVAKLGHALLKTRNFLSTDMKNLEEESGFHKALKSFVQNAEIDVTWLLEEEKRIMALVKSTGDYFHGNAGKDEGLRLFVIVRDFLIMLEKVCKEVSNAPRRPVKPQKKENGPASTPSVSDSRQAASPDLRQRLFPAIQERRFSDSSSDDES